MFALAAGDWTEPQVLINALIKSEMFVEMITDISTD